MSVSIERDICRRYKDVSECQSGTSLKKEKVKTKTEKMVKKDAYLHISIDVAHENINLLFRPHSLFPLMT